MTEAVVTIEDQTGARRLLRRYLAHAEGQLPDAMFAKLEDYADQISNVVALAGAVETMWAQRDSLDDEGRRALGSLALFAGVNGWHSLAVRGPAMAQAMRRELGEKPPAGAPEPQPAEDDPEPIAEYRIA